MATNWQSWDELLRKVQSIVEEGNREHIANNTSNYTPTQYTPFSTLDSLNMQAKAWDWTDTDIASAYKSLANWLFLICWF